MKDKVEILFVSHDANRAGAQIFLYNAMVHLQEQGYGIVLLLVNDWGSMRKDFEDRFTTYSLSTAGGSRWSQLFGTSTSPLDLIRKHHDIAMVYVNTIASVHILPLLAQTWQVPVLTHIHELSYSITQFGTPEATDLLFAHSDLVVACSNAVAENLASVRGNAPLRVIHSFVNNDAVLKIHEGTDRTAVLLDWQLDPEYTWVAACGNADWRKAPDIFLQIAAQSTDPSLRFAWIGIQDSDPMKAQLIYDAKKLGITEKVAWISPTPRAVELISAMDLFLLCSREDPFPLVMLEAALCEKPIYAFTHTGGGDEFIEKDAGWQAPYLDVKALAQLLDTSSPEERKARGKAGRKKVLQQYRFEQSMQKITAVIQELMAPSEKRSPE